MEDNLSLCTDNDNGYLTNDSPNSSVFYDCSLETSTQTVTDAPNYQQPGSIDVTSADKLKQLVIDMPQNLEDDHKKQEMLREFETMVGKTTFNIIKSAILKDSQGPAKSIPTIPQPVKKKRGRPRKEKVPKALESKCDELEPHRKVGVWRPPNSNPKKGGRPRKVEKAKPSEPKRCKPIAREKMASNPKPQRAKTELDRLHQDIRQMFILKDLEKLPAQRKRPTTTYEDPTSTDDEQMFESDNRDFELKSSAEHDKDVDGTKNIETGSNETEPESVMHLSSPSVAPFKNCKSNESLPRIPLKVRQLNQDYEQVEANRSQSSKIKKRRLTVTVPARSRKESVKPTNEKQSEITKSPSVVEDFKQLDEKISDEDPPVHLKSVEELFAEDKAFFDRERRILKQFEINKIKVHDFEATLCASGLKFTCYVCSFESVDQLTFTRHISNTHKLLTWSKFCQKCDTFLTNEDKSLESQFKHLLTHSDELEMQRVKVKQEDKKRAAVTVTTLDD